MGCHCLLRRLYLAHGKSLFIAISVYMLNTFCFVLFLPKVSKSLHQSNVSYKNVYLCYLLVCQSTCFKDFSCTGFHRLYFIFKSIHNFVKMERNTHQETHETWVPHIELSKLRFFSSLKKSSKFSIFLIPEKFR